MKTNKEKFHTEHGLLPTAILDYQQLAQLSGFPEEALRTVGRRARKPQDPFSEKKPPKQEPKVKDLPARVYSFVMKSKAVFEKSDRDVAIQFGLLLDTPISVSDHSTPQVSECPQPHQTSDESLPERTVVLTGRFPGGVHTSLWCILEDHGQSFVAPVEGTTQCLESDTDEHTEWTPDDDPQPVSQSHSKTPRYLKPKQPRRQRPV